MNKYSSGTFRFLKIFRNSFMQQLFLLPDQVLCLYLIFKSPKDGLFAMPFISWLSSTYLFQTFSPCS